MSPSQSKGPSGESEKAGSTTTPRGTCPAESCANMLRELRELYDFHAEFLSWASMPCDNVARTSFAHSTELAFEWDAPETAVLWRTFRCRTCKMATHAVSSAGALSVVTNLKGKTKL